MFEPDLCLCDSNLLTKTLMVNRRQNAYCFPSFTPEKSVSATLFASALGHVSGFRLDGRWSNSRCHL